MSTCSQTRLEATFIAEDNSMLSFEEGEEFEVTKEDDGWSLGVKGNTKGWFPSDRVQLIVVEQQQQVVPFDPMSAVPPPPPPGAHFEEPVKLDPELLYEKVEKLGVGSYGSVYRCQERSSGSQVAIKIIELDDDDLDAREILEEVQTMRRLDNQFVIKYINAFIRKQSDELYIVMEYCAAGSAYDMMKILGSPLDEAVIRIIVSQVTRGLKYLHSNHFIHRDIKAGNIMLNAEGECKLGDFGVTGELSNDVVKRHTVIGSPYWMAPEVIREVGYDQKADIWSLGITIIEMYTMNPPLADHHPMRVLFMIPKNDPPAISSNDKLLTDFVSLCLTKEPNSRSSAAALLQSPYLLSAPKDRSPLVEQVGIVMWKIEKEGRHVDSAEEEESSSCEFEEYDDEAVSQALATLTAGDAQVFAGGTTAIRDDDVPAPDSAHRVIAPDRGGVVTMGRAAGKKKSTVLTLRGKKGKRTRVTMRAGVEKDIFGNAQAPLTREQVAQRMKSLKEAQAELEQKKQASLELQKSMKSIQQAKLELARKMKERMETLRGMQN